MPISAETPAIVEIDGIDVHYGAVQALFGLSLKVHQGEVVSVLGGNASGKSTTTKSVLGLVRPTRGSIRVFGQDVARLAPADIIAKGVASIPEGRRVFPEMSVEENLLLGAYPVRREPRKVTEGMERVFEWFPLLKERRAQAAGTLSGGEQQMLALGRAWLRRPTFVCIDEPSMGLSPKFVDWVYEVLARWKAEGITILLVEQNARMALELADRAYVLQHGHVIAEGTAAELSQNEAIRRAYLGIV
ncbi:ABC transporter ATP-binding protein [Terrihabitans sp. B22-R8]|uniref:ABC transporter ATP-binding protein n=1 Tax=Terrihabitans sp. B22-R8 TaxID=3425128 RepID=UPI00403CA26E